MHSPTSGPGTIAALPAQSELLGGTGQLESTVSDEAVLTAARRLRIVPADGPSSTIAAVLRAARQGNQPAVDLLAERARVLGEAVALLRDMLNPDDLVVGGQAFTEYPEGMALVEAAYAERSVLAPRDIRVTSFGNRVQEAGAGVVSLGGLYADPDRRDAARGARQDRLTRSDQGQTRRRRGPGVSMGCARSRLVGPYLAAGPAGDRRRGRDERLRPAERAGAGPPRRRGRDLHQGDVVGGRRRWCGWRPGVLVRNVVAGPFEGLDKHDLPTQLCAFTAGVLRAEATHEPGYYDVVHSHYWLSGQVGWLARDRWAVPLVHTAHTLAAVKNASLAIGDAARAAAARRSASSRWSTRPTG